MTHTAQPHSDAASDTVTPAAQREPTAEEQA